MSTGTATAAGSDAAALGLLEGCSPASDWFQSERVAARERFLELGVPGPHVEAWRQTPTGVITGTDWSPAESAGVLDPAWRAALGLDGWAGPQIVFCDGRLIPEWSQLDALPDGLTLLPLGETLAVNRSALEPVLGRLADWRHDAFTALNTAAFTGGVFCHVAPGARIESPVRACFLSTSTSSSTSPTSPPGGEDARHHHGRVLLQLDERAALSWVEVHARVAGTAPVFATHVTEAAVGPAAQLEHVTWQAPGDGGRLVSVMQAGAERDARLALRSFTVAPGSAWVRNDVRVRFDAPGAEADLDGCWIADDTALVDYHTAVRHSAENTTSRQLYKGVQGGASRGVFEGHVLIQPGAQHTGATQSNRNLLLSDAARVHTKPLLEIYADDVQCAHGAAIGQLDADALFYLRQRGIGLDQARALLAEAFIGEVAGRIVDAGTAEWIGARLLAALPAGGGA